jgi:hypothetical protein
MREDLLVEMVKDGPWRTCVQHWATIKKDPAQVDRMDQGAFACNHDEYNYGVKHNTCQGPHGKTGSI